VSEQSGEVPPLYTPEFYADPHPTYRQLRERGPVCQVRAPNGLDLWLVTRYEEARAALSDPRLSKDPRHAADAFARCGFPTFLKETAALARHMLNADPPDHTRLRRLVTKAFTRRRIEELRPRVQQITDELLDTLVSRGQADLIEEFAVPLPITVICELFGVPAEDRYDLRTWSTAVIFIDDFTESSRQPAITALLNLHRYLGALIADKRAHPGDDLMSMLIAVRDTEDHLGEDELLSMAYLLLIAGHETTTNLIGNGMLALLRNPEQLRRLRAEPAGLPAAIEEFLRHGAPAATATFRITLEEVEIGKITIPPGEIVSVVLAAANRDPRQFGEPARLDTSRQDSAHLAFGHGIHFCLGASLARMEAQIAFEALLRRLPDLALAIPEEDLRYRPVTLMHGLQGLPVTFTAVPPNNRQG